MNPRVISTILLLVLVFMSIKEALAIIRKESKYLTSIDGENKNNPNMKVVPLLLIIGAILALVIPSFNIGLALLLVGWIIIFYQSYNRNCVDNYISIVLYLGIAVTLIFLHHPLTL